MLFMSNIFQNLFLSFIQEMEILWKLYVYDHVFSKYRQILKTFVRSTQ